MSWKLQALVADRVCGSITRKMVLLNMASRANDDGTGVYASLPMIAGWCEVDARTVRRVVRDLEAECVIVQCGWKDVKNGKINAWNVNVEVVESLPLYKDELAVKRAEKAAKKATPDTVPAVKKTRKKSVLYASHPGHTVRADIKPERTQRPATPDTAPASSILEPNTLFEEANASPNSAVVVQLRAGDGSQALTLYAEAAKVHGWTAPRGQPSAKRKTAIKARLRECGGLDGWREQIERAAQMPFLAGDNDRGWVMDADFFASSKGWSAILEGKYLRSTNFRNANVERAYATNGPVNIKRKSNAYSDLLVQGMLDGSSIDGGRLDSSAIK